MPGDQGDSTRTGEQLPVRSGQPEGPSETALPDGAAIKGRGALTSLPARFPVSGKCTSHLGFSLVVPELLRRQANALTRSGMGNGSH